MLKAANFSKVNLALPQDLPNTLQITVNYKDKNYTLDMSGISFGDQFEILEHNSKGIHPIPLPDIKLYRGHIQDHPESLVAASLLPGGRLDAFVRTNDHSFYIYPDLENPNDKSNHVVYDSPKSADSENHQPPLKPGEMADSETTINTCQKYSAILGLDCAYDYVTLCGGKQEAITNVVGSLNKVYAIFLKDLGIQYDSGLLVLRTDQATCPYSGLNTIAEFLAKIKETWNKDYSSRNYNSAQVISSKFPCSGLTYVGTVCNKPWSYGASGTNCNGNLKQFDNVLRHEMGHTWSAPDLPGNCLQGKTIMCGNQLPYFSDFTINLIRTYAAKQSCLECAS